MYREVQFELVEGRPVTPLFETLVHEPRARARLQALSVNADMATVLVDYTGPSAAVERLRTVLRSPWSRTLVRCDALVDERRHLRFVAVWREGADPHRDGVSLEHILHRAVGPGALLFGRVEGGVVAYKAAAPEGEGLRRFLDEVTRAFDGRFRVRPLRMGIFRPGWEIEDLPRPMDPEDEALLAVALSSGYYDEPKRCGVRELGDALGVSKSVVARKLRLLERRALERFAH